MISRAFQSNGLNIGLARITGHLYQLFGISMPTSLEKSLKKTDYLRNPYDQESIKRYINLLNSEGEIPLPPIKGQLRIESPLSAEDQEKHAQLVKQANECECAGSYQEALVIIWILISKFPNCSIGWSQAALFFANHGEFSSASVALKRCASMEPKFPKSISAFALSVSRLAEYGAVDISAYTDQLAALSSANKVPDISIEYARMLAGLPASSVPHIRLDSDSTDQVQQLFMDAAIKYNRANFPGSYESLCKAIECNYSLALIKIIHTFTSQTESLLRELEKRDEFCNLLDRLYLDHPESNVMPAWMSLASIQTSKRLRAEAMEKGLPSMPLITAGKSASVSVGAIFSCGFALPTVLYSCAVSGVIPNWAENFKKGGGSYVTHLWGTKKNVQLLLQHGIQKVFVHVRDPRQQMISNIHHITKYANQTDITIQRQMESLKNANEVFEYAISEILPESIRWISLWVEASKTLNVRFSTFEQFVTDKDRFIDRMVEDYGGNTKFFNKTAALGTNQNTDYHFRKGEIDEWKQLLSKEQIKRINDTMPPEFWTLFKWEP